MHKFKFCRNFAEIMQKLYKIIYKICTDYA